MNTLGISRGDIWMLDWSPARGSGQEGFRPGVIVQCDDGNHAPGARTTLLVPLTSQGRAFCFYVPIPPGPTTGLRVASWANCTQLFTVDRSRLQSRLGVAPTEAMEAISQALGDVLGLPSPLD